jgi:hypothetical protein
MMGALEATDGMLLFGISTAYIFTVMQDQFRLYAPLIEQEILMFRTSAALCPWVPSVGAGIHEPGPHVFPSGAGGHKTFMLKERV